MGLQRARVHSHHLSFQQLGNYLHGALHRHHLVDWLVGVGGLFSWLVGWCWWAIQLVGIGGLFSWLVGWCWLAIQLVGWCWLAIQLVLVGY